MRIAQFRILTKILNLVQIPSYIHGFEKDKSIPRMARDHIGKKIVISIDIKDFFPSIKEYMVRSMFGQLGFGESAARLLSELCTYRAFVPQGSLTAPKISNIIAAGSFGPEVEAYCKSQNISMTIYADDVTMSYSKDFENVEESKSFARQVITEVTGLIEKHGFRVNHAKTKVMHRGTRQWVCGAVVNDKVNMSRKERYKLKAIVHNTRKNGVEAEAAKSKLSVESFIRKTAGRINWLCQLNADTGVNLKADFRKSTAPYLKKYPDVQIPELAWNSGVEVPFEGTAKDYTDIGDIEGTVTAEKLGIAAF